MTLIHKEDVKSSKDKRIKDEYVLSSILNSKLKQDKCCPILGKYDTTMTLPSYKSHIPGQVVINHKLNHYHCRYLNINKL